MNTDNLIPTPWRMIVQPSPVDMEEEELPSGLLVAKDKPDEELHDHCQVKRGVALRIGQAIQEQEARPEVGNVVYYRHELVIGDVHVVDATELIAWESA